MASTVCLAGTLDTKGEEYAFVKERLLAVGVDVLVVDCGVLGDPFFEPEVSAAEVAEKGGINLDDFRGAQEGDGRVSANQGMSKGLGVVLRELVADGRIDAVLGMGGTGGTDLTSGAFRTLPMGFPKLIVSTMASNNTRPYVGHSDMHMANAVTDIAGLNSVSRLVLANAAHSIAGMAQGYATTKELAAASEPLIAISMFGVTTPGVMRMREQLEAKGFQVVTFHAVGEGAGMEHLIDEGVIDGLIDFTLPEIINRWNNGIFDPGIDRMKAATRNDIPLVVVPGAAECFNFGAVDTIPAEYNVPERNVLIHNPNITSLQATPDELTKLGEYIAEHVNAAKGPKAMALPLGGLDNYFREGSQWHGTDVSNLFDAIRANLDDGIELVEMDNNINDEPFADAVFNLFMERWTQAQSA
ncbi:MAG: Tm-1-like ATP-binding domain-containing protein [Actinomycetota bacterium]